MNLTVGERLTLLSIVPRTGSIATLRIVQDLIHEEEHLAASPLPPEVIGEVDVAYHVRLLQSDGV